MKPTIFFYWIKKCRFVTCILLMNCTSALGQDNQKITIDDDIQLIHLQDSIFIHETWHDHETYGRFPSNGLLIIRHGEALMIDTPFDNAKTQKLSEFLRDSMSVNITKLIIGHFHEDCLGGLNYLQSIGVESIVNSRTVDKCLQKNLPVPSISFNDSLSFDFHEEKISCRYFGAGHSPDNITVWLPYYNVLFGGCLVKSNYSQNLGNLSDAVLFEWDNTVERMMNEYPEVKFVIPGHGPYGGRELFEHTMYLVIEEQSK